MHNRLIALLLVFIPLTNLPHLCARPPAGAPLTLRQQLHFANRSLISTRLVAGTRTLEAKSLSELVALTAPVARDAPQRYKNFGSYFRAANLHGQRSGKTLEAVLAWRANQTAIRQRLPNRFLITAAEGFHTHAADLIEVVEGRHVASYQVKLRLKLKSASRYLADPRYEGMTLLTTRESHRRIVRELARKEAEAIQRGVPLAKKWQRTRDAIDSGRLPSRFAGRALPTIRGTTTYTTQSTKTQFAGHLSKKPPFAAHSTSVARFAGRTLAAGELVVVSNFQYRDTRMLMAGEIAADMYTARSTLRGIQLGLTVYALVTVDPVSKLGAGITVAALVGVDIGLDLVQQRRTAAAQTVLALVDREEKYLAARKCIFAGAP